MHTRLWLLWSCMYACLVTDFRSVCQVTSWPYKKLPSNYDFFQMLPWFVYYTYFFARMSMLFHRSNWQHPDLTLTFRLPETLVVFCDLPRRRQIERLAWNLARLLHPSRCWKYDFKSNSVICCPLLFWSKENNGTRAIVLHHVTDWEYSSSIALFLFTFHSFFRSSHACFLPECILCNAQNTTCCTR